MLSRAMIRLPIAACSTTSNRCRSISSRSFLSSLRPRRSAVDAVDDRRQGIDAVVMDQHVEAHQVGGAVAEELVVHRAVAVRHRLELVVQVVDDLRQRHLEDEDGPRRAEVLGADVDAAALGAHAASGRRCCSAGSRKLMRTIGSRNSSIWPASGTFCGLSMTMRLALARQDLVGDVRRGLHQVEVAVALQALLDDLAVEHAEEAAAEAEAEPLADFRAGR